MLQALARLIPLVSGSRSGGVTDPKLQLLETLRR